MAILIYASISPFGESHGRLAQTQCPPAQEYGVLVLSCDPPPPLTVDRLPLPRLDISLTEYLNFNRISALATSHLLH